MHTLPTSMAADTANLLHSSQTITSAAVAARLAIPALLLQPIWTAEQLRVLRVKEKTEVSAAAIVGKFHLPRDGREEFDDLASEITQASASAISDFATSSHTLNRNIFSPLFSSLREMTGLETGYTSQNRYVRAAKTAIQNLIDTVLPYADDEGSLRLDLNSVPFHLKRIAVKGVLACDGCIIKADWAGGLSPLPVAAFSVVRPKDQEDVEAQEASQLVLQAALAYEQNSRLNTYKAYAIHINRTRLQVVSADIPRALLERLYQGGASQDGFDVLHSESFDLLDVEGRREALRLMFGLLKSLCARSKGNAF